MNRVSKKEKNKRILISVIIMSVVLIVGIGVFFLINKNTATTVLSSISGNGWVYKDNNIYYYENNKPKTGWSTIDGKSYCFKNDGTLIKEMKMIDVSEFQGDVDWEKVKADGIQIAMIRCSYGWEAYPSQVDKNFEKNYTDAKNAGLKVGVYHYSYATNEQEALLEAEYVKKALSGKEIDFEVAYDVEDDVHTSLSVDEYSNIINQFCTQMKSYGYTPMIYSKSEYLICKYKDRSLYNVWVAQYSEKCTYEKDYVAWQYTDKGLISGIEGFTDFSIRYFK